MPERNLRGTRWATRSTPSTRKRTITASSCGSKCTSLAPSSAAWKMIELTSRTIGPSVMPSSASRSSAASSTGARSSSSTELNASLARDSRRISSWTSSSGAIANCTAYRVASRSSSIEWTFSGSVIATERMSSSKANGIAPTRSSTLSGTSFVASGLMPTTARSTSGMRKRVASSRAAVMSGGVAGGAFVPASTRRIFFGALCVDGHRSCPIGVCCRTLEENRCSSRERPVPMQDRQTGEQRDDAAERQERPERNLHLAGRAAVAREQPHGGNSAESIATISATGVDRPTPAPISSASFTSPIPMPPGYASAASSRNADPPKAPSRPFGRGMHGRHPAEHDGCGRQHDHIGDHPALEVGRRDGDERRAERCRDECVSREAEPEEARRDEHRSEQLDGWIDEPDLSSCTNGSVRGARRTTAGGRCRTRG